LEKRTRGNTEGYIRRNAILTKTKSTASQDEYLPSQADHGPPLPQRRQQSGQLDVSPYFMNGNDTSSDTDVSAETVIAACDHNIRKEEGIVLFDFFVPLSNSNDNYMDI
jgi:hypothetical protein